MVSLRIKLSAAAALQAGLHSAHLERESGPCAEADEGLAEAPCRLGSRWARSSRDVDRRAERRTQLGRRAIELQGSHRDAMCRCAHVAREHASQGLAVLLHETADLGLTVGRNAQHVEADDANAWHAERSHHRRLTRPLRNAIRHVQATAFAKDENFIAIQYAQKPAK
eukprot:2556274-Pleurochrysis_carterae.AAC.2